MDDQVSSTTHNNPSPKLNHTYLYTDLITTQTRYQFGKHRTNTKTQLQLTAFGLLIFILITSGWSVHKFCVHTLNIYYYSVGERE